MRRARARAAEDDTEFSDEDDEADHEDAAYADERDDA
jgi:hypothetical protein